MNMAGLLQSFLVSIILTSFADAFSVHQATLQPRKDSSTTTALGGTTTLTAVKHDDRENETLDTYGRRDFMLLSAANFLMLATTPIVAQAKYGDSTSIKLPNYIEFLEEKAKTVDPSTYAYQGVDPLTILRRLGEASVKLEEIPALAEERKWSQIQGVLTGPLGTLSVTLGQVISMPSSMAQKKALVVVAQELKSNLNAIGVGATKKSPEAVSKSTSDATKELTKFVKLAFPE